MIKENQQISCEIVAESNRLDRLSKTYPESPFNEQQKFEDDADVTESLLKSMSAGIPPPDMWSWDYIGLYCQYAAVGLMYGSSGTCLPFCVYSFQGGSNLCANAKHITYFAWSMKVVFAFITDMFHPFGLKRRPWMVFGWSGVLACLLVLATAAHLMPIYLWLVMLMLAQGFLMMSDVPADGYSVELGQIEPPGQRGQIVATGQRIRFTFCVVAGFIQAFLLNGPSTNASDCADNFSGCWPWGLTINGYYGLLFSLVLVLTIPITWMKELSHHESDWYSANGGSPIVELDVEDVIFERDRDTTKDTISDTDTSRNTVADGGSDDLFLHSNTLASKRGNQQDKADKLTTGPISNPLVVPIYGDKRRRSGYDYDGEDGGDDGDDGNAECEGSGHSGYKHSREGRREERGRRGIEEGSAIRETGRHLPNMRGALQETSPRIDKNSVERTERERAAAREEPKGTADKVRYSLPILGPPRHTMSDFFGKIWKMLQNLTTLYLLIYTIGIQSLSNFTSNVNIYLQYYVIELNNFQAGMDVATNYLALVIGIWLFQKYLLNKNWHIAQYGSSVCGAFLALVWIAPYHNAGGTRNPYFTILIDVDSGFAQGFSQVLFSLAVIELAHKGQEATTYELMVTVANAALTLNGIVSTQLLTPLKCAACFEQPCPSDTVDVSSVAAYEASDGPARFTIYAILLSLTSLCAVAVFTRFLPRSKEECHEWRRLGDRKGLNLITGYASLFLLGFTILYGMTVAILLLDTQTSCLTAVGGTGC